MGENSSREAGGDGRKGKVGVAVGEPSAAGRSGIWMARIRGFKVFFFQLKNAEAEAPRSVCWGEVSKERMGAAPAQYLKCKSGCIIPLLKTLCIMVG